MKEHKAERRRKDKSDFATVDKVLDARTISILNKLQRREKIFDLSGAVSSGKEANIYTARCSNSLISKFIQKSVDDPELIVPVVLKIYKTSAMLFKDRDRYIVDEKRFSNFCTSNSRKLMKVWAEKEVRNLKRMAKHGIPCPAPIYLKRSVLVMTMIGDTEPAPRLKDANVDDWTRVYHECIGILRDLYQRAGLIHADFSEYNLIYHSGRVHVIDVGQSIEKDHDNSNNFLAMDIRNCNEFFERKGVAVRDEVGIFEEITGLRVPQYLKKDGKLSRDTFIPSRITEVVNREDLALFVQQKERGGDSDASDYYSDDSTESVDDSGESADGRSYSSESTDRGGEEPEGSGPATDSQMSAEAQINIYVRRLRLKNPEMTKEEEKAINAKRKQIVKEMNRERRSLRAMKNDRIKTQKVKKISKKHNKK